MSAILINHWSILTRSWPRGRISSDFMYSLGYMSVEIGMVEWIESTFVLLFVPVPCYYFSGIVKWCFRLNFCSCTIIITLSPLFYKYHRVPLTQTEKFVSNIKMWYKSGSNLISVALCVTTCILTFNYWSISQVSYSLF